jgi:hypothetical protein
MENLGGGQQSSIVLLSLPVGFLFSPYSNNHIFEYIRMPDHRLNDNITRCMLPKWNATTSHNFTSSSDQSSSSHIGSIINNNDNFQNQSNSEPYKWQTACSPT